jgi:hypothetical protein
LYTQDLRLSWTREKHLIASPACEEQLFNFPI